MLILTLSLPPYSSLLLPHVIWYTHSNSPSVSPRFSLPLSLSLSLSLSLAVHSILGYTALHAAVEFSVKEMILELCALGVPVNIRDFKKGQTPLHYAGVCLWERESVSACVEARDCVSLCSKNRDWVYAHLCECEMECFGSIFLYNFILPHTVLRIYILTIK